MIKTKSWVRFNDVYSYDYGIVVEKLPDIVIPSRNVDTFNVAGRSGSLHIDHGTFNNYSRAVECALLVDCNINKIAAWLTGFGDVVFSNEPDKVYKAAVYDQIPLAKVIRFYKRFLVIFDCQPFKYSLHPWQDELTFTAPTSFMGKGTARSRPVVMIYGQGNIFLDINGTVINLVGVDGSITINADIMDAYKGTQNQNNKMHGEFPYLLPGENIVDWDGNISKIVIQPNWAWL